MGWIRDNGDPRSYAHEGHIVAVVRIDPHTRAEMPDQYGDRGSFWRELGYPHDDRPRARIHYVQAACGCGWRSPRIVALGRWFPFAVEVNEAVEERCCALWEQHIDAELAAPADERMRAFAEGRS